VGEIISFHAKSPRSPQSCQFTYSSLEGRSEPAVDRPSCWTAAEPALDDFFVNSVVLRLAGWFCQERAGFVFQLVDGGNEFVDFVRPAPIFR
jgi:hypothetical protein